MSLFLVSFVSPYVLLVAKTTLSHTRCSTVCPLFYMTYLNPYLLIWDAYAHIVNTHFLCLPYAERM